MLRIPFESFQFAFECFKSLSSCSNLDLNASIPFQMVRIWIEMLQIPFECFEFGFECFESCSSGSNLHSNASNLLSCLNLDSIASNPFQMFRNFIRLLRIAFKWVEFGFECFESFSNGSNLDLNALNPF